MVATQRGVAGPSDQVGGLRRCASVTAGAGQAAIAPKRELEVRDQGVVARPDPRLFAVGKGDVVAETILELALQAARNPHRLEVAAALGRSEAEHRVAAGPAAFRYRIASVAKQFRITTVPMQQRYS